MYQNNHRFPHMPGWLPRLLVTSVFFLTIAVQASWSESNSALDQRRQMGTPTREDTPALPAKRQRQQLLIETLRHNTRDPGETAEGVVVTFPSTIRAAAAIDLTNAARVQMRPLAVARHTDKYPQQVKSIGYISLPIDPVGCDHTRALHGTQQVAFAREAAGVSRQPSHLQSADAPPTRFVSRCAVTDLTPPVQEPRAKRSIVT